MVVVCHVCVKSWIKILSIFSATTVVKLRKCEESSKGRFYRVQVGFKDFIPWAVGCGPTVRVRVGDRRCI